MTDALPCSVRYGTCLVTVAAQAESPALPRNRHYGAPRIIRAPYSVDDERFAGSPPTSRSELLSRWDLDGHKPVILFCGKLSQRKRPLDLCAAAKAVAQDVNVLFVGDGVLTDEVRACLRPGSGAVTGFVNQSELPTYYHAADIIVLPSEWEPRGLVVNEAMAAGVLPVVSVGSARDQISSSAWARFMLAVIRETSPAPSAAL